MPKQSHTAAKHIDFIVIDLVSIVVSLFIAYLIRTDRADDLEYFERYRNLGLVIIVIYLVFITFNNAHSNILKRTALRELSQIVLLNVTIILTVFAVLFAMKQSEIYSRTIIAMFAIFDCLLMFSCRLLRKASLLRQFSEGKNTSKVIVVTYENSAEKIIQTLRRENSGYYEFVGIVLLGESTTTEIKRIPVIKMEGILDYIKENAINEVYIFCKHGESGKLMSKFMIMGLTVHVGLNLELKNLSNVTIENIANFTVVTSTISRATIGELFVKRLFDIVISLFGIVCTLLLFLFVAPIIKIQAPGPVFFVQRRVGKNGKTFNMLKFRSMYVDAELKKSQLLSKNEMNGPVFKIEDDPRVFPFGKFMRKTSIDEFPQFFNILVGDMSLVGTRPPTLDEFEQYKTHHMSRLAMKPGLTGMWQSSGRSEITDFEEIVRLDNEYIRNFSLALDIKILFKTLFAVLSRKGSK